MIPEIRVMIDRAGILDEVVKEEYRLVMFSAPGNRFLVRDSRGCRIIKLTTVRSIRKAINLFQGGTLFWKFNSFLMSDFIIFIFRLGIYKGLVKFRNC